MPFEVKSEGERKIEQEGNGHWVFLKQSDCEMSLFVLLLSRSLASHLQQFKCILSAVIFSFITNNTLADNLGYLTPVLSDVPLGVPVACPRFCVLRSCVHHSVPYGSKRAIVHQLTIQLALRHALVVSNQNHSYHLTSQISSLLVLTSTALLMLHCFACALSFHRNAPLL